MSLCATCGTHAIPGALLCASSGTAVASPAPVLALAPLGSMQKSSQAHALAVVEHGVADHSRRIELPNGDFTMTLGRHDLITTPPVVVDVDLTAYCSVIELPNGARGYPVSRRQATLSRFAGSVTVTSNTPGNTFVRRLGSSDFEGLAPNDSRVLEVGSRVIFGIQQPLIFELI